MAGGPATRRGWPLRATRCPCDLDFIDWLRTNEIRDSTIFHFGTGLHHVVGRAARQAGTNTVLGITASIEEYEAYQRAVAADADLARSYQVLCTDIYSLPTELLPQLDVATLFHLCEFSTTPRQDEALLHILIRAVRIGGSALFYTGSDGYAAAEPLVRQAVADNRLTPRGRAGSLAVFGVSGPQR